MYVIFHAKSIIHILSIVYLTKRFEQPPLTPLECSNIGNNHVLIPFFYVILCSACWHLDETNKNGESIHITSPNRFSDCFRQWAASVLARSGFIETNIEFKRQSTLVRSQSN